MSDARKYLQKGNGLVYRSKFKDAIKAYRWALKKSENEDEELTSNLALGDTYRLTGDFDLSIEHYEAALKLAGKAGGTQLDASVGLALAKRALGHHKEALAILAKVEKAYAKSGDKEGIAFTLWAKGGTLRIKGDIQEAIKCFEEARKLFVSLKDKKAEAYCLCGLGGTNRIAGQFKKSLEYYEKANAAFKAIKDTFGMAYSHCGMGNALRMMEDFNGSRDHFVRAAALYQRIGDIVSYSYTLWSLGMTNIFSGLLNLAEKYFKDAKSNFRKTGDVRGIIYCRMGVAQIRALQARPGTISPDAKRMLTQAVGEAKQYRFEVELCHAEALLGKIANGTVDNSCYKALGLKLAFSELPFNIP